MHYAIKTSPGEAFQGPRDGRPGFDVYSWPRIYYERPWHMLRKIGSEGKGDKSDEKLGNLRIRAGAAAFGRAGPRVFYRLSLAALMLMAGSLPPADRAAADTPPQAIRVGSNRTSRPMNSSTAAGSRMAIRWS